MATNLVYAGHGLDNRVEDLGATIAPGTPVVSKAGLPAVAVTGTADYTKSMSIEGGMTLSGIPAGGVGLKGQEATLAFNGTWEFDKEAFTSSTLPTSNIDQGDPVYITSGGSLTTSAGGNDKFGYFDYTPDYDMGRGFLPVRIGA